MFQIIFGLFSIAFTLTKTALFIVFKLWKISLPVIGLLLLFKLGNFWGFLFLLPACVLILVQVRKLMKRRVPKKGLSDLQRKIISELSESTHLQDFFAPLSEGFTTASGVPDIARRSEAVRRAVVEVEEVRSPLQKPSESAEKVAVTFRVSGDTEALKRLLPAMRNELFYDAVTPTKDSRDRGGYFKVLITPAPVEDYLLSQTFSSPELFKSVPMADRTLMKLPIAVDERGEWQSLSIHHTSIFGMSGSGKGSPLQTVLQWYFTAPEGEESFWEQGLVTAYFIDGKSAEFGKLKNSLIAEPFISENGQEKGVASSSVPDAERVIHEVFERMTKRESLNFREIKLSKSAPLILLMWDEFSSTVGKLSKEASAELLSIYSKGRSLGIYIISASQGVNKSVLGNFRDHFANRLILRQATAYDASTITQLEQSYLEEVGVTPHLIPNSSSANGYRTAGIGYLADEDNDFQRVRFFYCETEAVERLAKETTPPELWEDNYVFAEGEVV